MASKPGLLSDWPWKPLGSFKYALIAPFIGQSIYSFATKDPSERNLMNFLVFPFLLWRLFHSQVWISYSRYRTAKSRIVEKSIEFEQVDRERDWTDQILVTGLIFYLTSMNPASAKMPIWRTDSVIISFLVHIGPIEFLYYWFHRALHHHYLYTRYHSHHHSSIVTEPITSIVHPFAEQFIYLILFGLPMVVNDLLGTSSIVSTFGYLAVFDFLNNMGHCNFEFIPTWLFYAFPPLKYLIYTPSFHSLHHTQFRTNLSLFMPIYDYIYGTMDKSSEVLHETSLQKQEDKPDVIHLTHLTTADSIYHFRLGFPSISSHPQRSKWYLELLSPITNWWSTIMTSFYGQTIVAERNSFKDLKLQSWAIPRFNSQYFSKWQRKSINGMIENAILEADAKGTKVLSLGLLNQSKELNQNGEFYIQKFPKLKVKVVDGSSLAVAIVLNNIPQGTTQVLLRGKITKVASSVASILCQRGIQVAADGEEYDALKDSIKASDNLIRASGYDQKVWVVGEGLTDDEQSRAAKGTIIIPFSALPPAKVRDDCLYHHTPAMVIPASVENVDSCENWLPRRVMSAARVSGMVHALEGWTEHECGSTILDVGKVWESSLKHGFRPLTTSY